MEGYVITMKEREGNKVETSVLGIFENKEDGVIKIAIYNE